MANVLPPNEKKRIVREIRSRFVIVTALALLLGALIAAAALVPALLSVMLATNNLPGEAQLSETVRDDQAKQARTLAIVTALNPVVTATTTPTASAVAALAAKPKGVSVTSVSYSKGKLLVSGVSANRQAVNDYREALEAEAQFTSVTVPVAALVGTQEGRFTMTLMGPF